MNRKYSWIPDLPDQRDYLPTLKGIGVPPSVDLRPHLYDCWDQGNFGSCTGNAVGACIMFDVIKRKERLPLKPSRLMLYYWGRELEGTTGFDGGAMIRDVVKGANANGVCRECFWDYTQSNLLTHPTKKAMAAVKEHALTYVRLDTSPRSLVVMKEVLAEGYPFVYGFTVYESFESNAVAVTGKVPMPGPNEAVLGGHAVTAMGYVDDPSWVGGGYFIVRNSWGTGWGQNGHCYFPYQYLLDDSISADFWAIYTVS